MRSGIRRSTIKNGGRKRHTPIWYENEGLIHSDRKYIKKLLFYNALVSAMSWNAIPAMWSLMEKASIILKQIPWLKKPAFYGHENDEEIIIRILKEYIGQAE